MKSASWSNYLFSITFAIVAPSVATAEAFPITPGASCTSSSCHDSLGTKKYVHAVVNGATCVMCHLSTVEDRHDFQLKIQGGGLCAQCHGTKTDKEFKHAPVAAGMCTFCHNPHQSDNPKQLNFPIDSLCLNCHAKTTYGGGREAHFPAVSGQCVVCHDPHTSDHPRQLKAALPDLCFECHDQPQNDFDDGTVLPAIKPLFDDKKLNQHPSFARGDCVLCHNPHSSENYRLQKGPYPESIYASFSPDKYFCFDCHSVEAFKEPRTTVVTQFRNGNLNLHHRHVNRDKGRSCRACHHHHASPRDALIRVETPFGNRHIEISNFQKTATGGSCEPVCHRPTKYDRLDPAINAFRVSEREGVDATQAQLRQAIGPEDGADLYNSYCQPCHAPNGRGREPYPAVAGSTSKLISTQLEYNPDKRHLSGLGGVGVAAIASYLRVAAELLAATPPDIDGASLYASNCAACHGAEGAGVATFPAVIGASAASISAQIASNPIMAPFANLSDAEIQAIADHLADLAPAPDPAAPEPAIVEPPPTAAPATEPAPAPPIAEPAAPDIDGASLYASNCAACHGAEGAGVATFPAVIGASAASISAQIASNPIMAPFANLSDAEIQAIADHLADLAPAPDPAAPEPAIVEPPPTAAPATEPAPAPPIAEPAAPDIDGASLYASNCAACHGAEGAGVATFPAVIGASAASISAQIASNPIMAPFANLSDAEIQAIADHLADLAPAPDPAAPAAAATPEPAIVEPPPTAAPATEPAPAPPIAEPAAPDIDGASLYASNCAACHGAEGAGVATFPAVIGASAASISAQIASNPIMAPFANLSDAEIQAIADHLADLAP